mmetsp:Transcript_15034/g.24893  ORF Transcript_15034/g.24893 Transcript_15034/m.24893 type:complete len:252 (-) Transcript_15034:1117-1872(-)
MDLPSASALAEAALSTTEQLLGSSDSTGGSSTGIDGILACGPFVSHATLQPYLTTTASSSTNSRTNPVLMHAKEGLVTGCLSQLESIVCRVVWLPCGTTNNDGTTNNNNNTTSNNNTIGEDPMTLLQLELSSSSSSQDDEERRLTPNSRNIHKRHLPLAPGLACCGLGGTASNTTTPTPNDEETTTATKTTTATTTSMIESLLDLAAPLSEQLPTAANDDASAAQLQFEQSVAIVMTTTTTTTRWPLERTY